MNFLTNSFIYWTLYSNDVANPFQIFLQIQIPKLHSRTLKFYVRTGRKESTESYSQSLKLQDLEQAPGLGSYIYFGKLTAPFLLMLLEATCCSEPFVAKVTSNSESWNSNDPIEWIINLAGCDWGWGAGVQGLSDSQKRKKVYNQKSIYINNLFDIDCHVEKVYLTVSW